VTETETETVAAPVAVTGTVSAAVTVTVAVRVTAAKTAPENALITSTGRAWYAIVPARSTKRRVSFRHNGDTGQPTGT